MANPPNSGAGTDIANLKLGVDSTEVSMATEALDKFGTATVVTTRKVNSLNEVLKSNNDWMEQSKAKHKNRIQQLTDEWEKEQKAIQDIKKAEQDAARATEMLAEAGQRYLDKLTTMNSEMGKTTAELQRMKAAELGVAEAAEPLITALERQSKSLSQMEYAAFRTMEAQEALYLKTAAAAEYSALRIMEANESVYLKGVAARTADEAALAKHVEEEIAMGKRKTQAAEYAALKEMEVAEALYLKRTAAAEYAALREMEANEAVFLKREIQMRADEAALAAHVEREISINKAKLEAAEYVALKEMEANESLYLKRTAAAEYAALKEMEANEAVFLKKQAQRKADEIAAEEHQRKELARIAAATSAAEYAAFRQMEAHEQVYLRKQQEREKDRIAAEKAAQADIRYAEMTTKQKIAELEKLAAYKGNSAIGGDMFNSMFSKAAQNDLINYTKHVKELEAAQEALKKTHSSAHAPATSVADALSKISFQSSRARSEIIVLAHEAVQGRFSRMPASMMVLAEYTNMASLAFTGFGVAALTAILAIGTTAWQMAKGAAELYHFNNAMQLTAGFSGQTRDSLHEMAVELKGNVHGQIHTATEMLLALNATGKFTAETLHAIGGAALNFQRLSGQSTDQVVGMFQQLGAVHGKVFNEMQNKIADWAAKQNETYHFLNAASYERIRMLALEGRNQEAMVEIADRMNESLEKQDRNVGYLMASYFGFKKLVQEIAHIMMEWGKEDSIGQQLDAAKQQLNALEKASMGFAQGMEKAGPNSIYAARFAAVALQYSKQATLVANLQRKYDEEQLKAQQKSEDKQIEAQGVFGQREVDYIETHSRRRNAIAETYIERYLQGVTMANRDAIHQWEKLHGIDAANNQKAMEAAVASGELQIIGAERVEKTIADIRNKYRNRDQNAKDDPRWIELQTTIAKFEEEGRKAKRAIDAQVADTRDALRDGEISIGEHYDKLRALEARELSNAQSVYDKKLAALKGFNAKTEVERAKVQKQMQDARAALDKAVDDNGAAGDNLNRDEAGANKRQLKETVQSIVSEGGRELETIERQVAEQEKYNLELGKTAEQRKLIAIKIAEEAQQDRIRYAEHIDHLLTLEKAKPEEEQNGAAIAAYGARLTYLQRAIAAYNKLTEVRKQGAALDAEEALNKQAYKLANDWNEAGKEIGNSLKKAFGEGGKALGDMFKAWAQGNAKQIELERDLAKAKKANEGLENEKFLNKKAEDKFAAQSARARMGEYGEMTNAAAGFFGEQSKGYKAMMTMSQVFHAAELAMTVAELVPKGIAAVLNQGNGDPYTAFARMAAMAALVAGLGVAIGGVGKKVDIAKERQEKQGTGSVLGDSKAKSESIAKSLDALKDNSYQDIQIAKGMLDSLRAIQNSISSFAALVVRDGNITGESYKEYNKKAPLNNGLVNAAGVIGGGLAGAAAGAYVGMGAYMSAGAAFGPLGMAIGAVIGATLGKFLGPVMGKVFGGKQTVVDSGFGMSKQTVGNIEQYGANGYSYGDIKTDGGWLHSDKYNRQWTSMGADANRQFTTIITSMADTIVSAGILLGESEQAMRDRVNAFTVDINNVSLKDKTGEEVEKIMAQVFSKLGDDMAKWSIAAVDGFAKVGEGQLETLTRMAQEYQTVELVFKSFNKSFGQVGIGSMAARERLLELSGGIEEFVSQASTFLDTFYSDKEKSNFLKGQVDPVFAKYGLTTSGPNADKMFRSFIESLDTTTQYGAEAYASLMSMVPAFKAILDVSKKIADERKNLQDELDELVMTPEQLLTKQRNELDESNRALFDQIQLIKKQREEQDKTKETLTQTIDKMKQFADSMRSMRDGLLLGNLSTLTPEQQYLEAQRQFDNVVAKAKAGDEDAQNQISSAANAFLEASRVVNASDTKYSSDFAKVLRITEEMEQWATTKASYEQQSLDALNAQVEGIRQLNNSLNSLVEAIGETRMPTPVAVALPPAQPISVTGAALAILGRALEGIREDANKNASNIISSNAKVTQEAAKATTNGIMEASRDSSYKQSVLKMELE